MRVNAIFHTDSSHGWLEVARDLLKDLQIENTVFLKEDSDIGILFNALKNKHGIKTLDNFFNIRETYTDRSFIRSLEYYKKTGGRK